MRGDHRRCQAEKPLIVLSKFPEPALTMDALVSRASMIWLSLQPSPASETSAFNKIRAFISLCAGLLPFRISVASCSRSSSLNRTTYFFTIISFRSHDPLRRSGRDKKRIIKSFQIG